MTAAFCSSACSMPATEARMRVSSVTRPSSIGTLRSQRMKTRLPRRSTSVMRLNAIIYPYYYFAATAPTSAKTAATSSIRLEKPHSLSYHEDTLTSVPSETRVRVESKIELAGLWLKSEETSGSVLYSRMPLRSPSQACFTARFTSSTVVGFLATKVRSTIDTLMVGTRIE